MENKDDKGIGDGSNPKDIKGDDNEGVGAGSELTDDQKDAIIRALHTQEVIEKGSDKGVDDEEVVKLEDTPEYVAGSGGNAESRLYRKAISEREEGNTEPELCQHYRYTDAEMDEYGYL